MPLRDRSAFALRIAFTLGASLALIAVGDTCAHLVYRNVDAYASIDPLLHAARRMHRWERNVVQFVPGCGRWDAELFYTLRPGSCTVENDEHTITYDVNEVGLRAAAADLEAPKVIVLGDSHVMGWGVGESETFSALLGRRLGVRVLNAGVSSYGTARELRLLERLDRSQLDLLVIVYSQNDDDENAEFVRGDYALPISSQERFEEITTQHSAKPRVPPWPFYLVRLVYYVGDYYVQLVEDRIELEEQPEIARREADYFLRTLSHFQPILGDVPIMVLEINSHNRNDTWFVDALSDAIAAGEHEPSNVFVVDVSDALIDEDYFLLDDHMTAAGHAAVAEKLLPLARARLGDARGIRLGTEVPAEPVSQGPQSVQE